MTGHHIDEANLTSNSKGGAGSSRHEWQALKISECFGSAMWHLPIPLQSVDSMITKYFEATVAWPKKCCKRERAGITGIREYFPPTHSLLEMVPDSNAP